MTDDTLNRIDRLVLAFGDGPSEPTIRKLFTDLALSAIEGERERTLRLLAGTYRFLMANKGRGVRKELEELERQIRIGQQQLWAEGAGSSS